jgi:hypothetical protein
VTLVVSVNGPETIWVVADRRLSRKGQPPKDDGRKIMLLDTLDGGVAILAYSGLGATALGTEPADWMSAVLRGRNLPLEQSLGVLAEATKNQLPRHVLRMPAGSHTVIVPAFLGKEVRLYTIDLAIAADRKSYAFRYTRHVVKKLPSDSPRTTRVSMCGSGGVYLDQDENKNKKIRSLLRAIKAYDHGQVSQLAVADQLASINF